MDKRYLYLVVAYAGLMSLLAILPLPVSYFIELRFVDKPLHFLAYAVLAGLITLGMHHADRKYAAWSLFFIPGFIASLCGVFGEALQYFVPVRNFGFLDMATNVAGAFSAQVFLCFFWLRVHRKPLQPSEQALRRKALRKKGVRHQFVPLQKPPEETQQGADPMERLSIEAPGGGVGARSPWRRYRVRRQSRKAARLQQSRARRSPSEQETS